MFILNCVTGVDNVVSGTVSNATEFTELPSRKTSFASNFTSSFSWNTYEDHIIQTKDEKDKWEFPRHHLKFYGILGMNDEFSMRFFKNLFLSGEGCFGQVWKCEALNIDGRKGITMVAVKTLKESASNKEREDLVAELNLMKTLLNDSHPNVVRLLGCCTSSSEKGKKFPLYRTT